MARTAPGGGRATIAAVLARGALGVRVALVTLVGLTACGRIGYDDRARDPDANGVAIDAAVDAVDGQPACPSGTVETCPGAAVCIEVAERGYAPWEAARDACQAVGRRLCAEAEWEEACTCASGLEEMIDDGGGSALAWEWVAEESGGVAHKRGWDSCLASSTHGITESYDFRCCADRW